jgi:hypothetical protein
VLEGLDVRAIFSSRKVGDRNVMVGRFQRCDTLYQVQQTFGGDDFEALTTERIGGDALSHIVGKGDKPSIRRLP